MKDLKITDRMLENAKSNKCVGWLYLDPVQFLSLTVTDHNVYDWIKKELPHTKTVDDYNSYETLMPWLDVDMHTGKVVGHEGRHRAAACIKSGSKRLPVAICLRDHGYPVYYTTPFEGDKSLVKVYVSKKDVPRVLVGQFVHRSLLIDTAHLHEFWASHNTKSSFLVRATTRAHLDRLKPVMARIVQTSKPTTATSCWAQCCRDAHTQNMHLGNLLIFGEPGASQILHAILCKPDGSVVKDTFKAAGGLYDPSKKAYARPNTGGETGWTLWPLVESIPLEELWTFPIN